MVDIPQFLKNYNFPLILKNKITQWQMLNWDKTKWCQLFEGRKMIFRCGKIDGRRPQWENECNSAQMTFSEFWDWSEKENLAENFMYFDYKEMSSLFPDRKDVLDSIKWSDIGHVDVDGIKSTLWIGSQGAHTPCHMDSYGYNMVAQLYGRKLWLLLPPEEMLRLKPTRVPYEESSVYSDINFFKPCKDFLRLEKMYRVVLEPGDVLFVPRHWWHYVENLQLSISVNTWIPVTEDAECRLEEALVQRFVWSTAQELTLEQAKKLLNPNELDLLENSPSDELIRAVAAKCIETRCRGMTNQTMSNEPPLELKDHLISPLLMSNGDKKSYYHDRANNTVGTTSQDDVDTAVEMAKVMINSFCNPEVVRIAKERFLDQLLASEQSKVND